MNEHDCIHENDFGLIFERIKNMTESFDGQKTAVSGLLKYMWEKEAIEINHEKKSLSARQRVQIIISAILGFSGIIITLIIEFHK